MSVESSTSVRRKVTTPVGRSGRSARAAHGLLAFAEQSIETVTIFGSTGFTQPGGPMNMQLGGGLTLAWILGFGLWGGLRGRYSVHSQLG